jgi:hypothetical protein
MVDISFALTEKASRFRLVVAPIGRQSTRDLQLS